MLVAMAILPGIDVLAKFLGQDGVPVMQIVWARLTFGALLTLPSPSATRVSGGWCQISPASTRCAPVY